MPARSYVNSNIGNWISGVSSMRQNPLASYNPSNSSSMAFGLDDALNIGSNLVGSVLNYASQRNAQKLQKQMFNEQLDFNDFWNTIDYKNENYWRHYDYYYNDLKQQVQRLRDNGLNPALMMGQMSPGFSSSQSAGTGNMSAPGAPSISPITAIGDAIQNLPQNRLLQEQIAFQREKTKTEQIENLYRAARLYADLEGKRESNRGANIANRIANLDLSIKSDTKEVVAQMMRQNLAKVTADTHQVQEETRGQIIENALQPFFAGLQAQHTENETKRIENDFKIGMHNAISNRIVSNAQAAMLDEQAQVLAQNAFTLKYANEHFATYEYRDENNNLTMMRVPYSLMVELSTFLEKQSNKKLTDKEIANFANEFARRNRETDANSANKYVTAIVAGLGMYYGSKFGGIGAKITKFRRNVGQNYRAYRWHVKTGKSPRSYQWKDWYPND